MTLYFPSLTFVVLLVVWKTLNMLDNLYYSWFPVHCTSMNNTNGLISGDNKGFASHVMERAMNPSMLPHEVKFVAAFAQANEGDVSPNTEGPHCLDTGLPCNNAHSTCNGKVCHSTCSVNNLPYVKYANTQSILIAVLLRYAPSTYLQT